jgi:hypothetical protein
MLHQESYQRLRHLPATRGVIHATVGRRQADNTVTEGDQSLVRNVWLHNALKVVGGIRIACEAIVGRQTRFARTTDTIGTLLVERNEVQLRDGVVLLHRVVVVCNAHCRVPFHCERAAAATAAVALVPLTLCSASISFIIVV